jgi:hypothetical protein
MKRLLTTGGAALATLALTLPVAHAAEPTATDATRIYYLGNSLTDELQYDQFVKLAEAGGVKIVWGRQMCPGIPINGLWGLREKGGFTKEPFGPWGKALSEFEWDVLTMQPFGNVFEPQMEAASKFTAELAKKSPSATVFIYAQWPDRGNNSPMVQIDSSDWEERFAGKQRNFETAGWAKEHAGEEFWYHHVVAKLSPPLNETFKDRSLKHQYEAFVHVINSRNPGNKPARLIPVGHAMQLLGQKMRAGLAPGYRTPWDFYSDGVHVNNDGSYIVACAFYATIFGKTPVGLPIGDYQGKPGFRDDGVKISPELVKLIQETVWEVVATHPLSGVASAEPIKVASPILDTAVVGEPYRFEVLPAFGKAPRKWKVAAGQLPAGISLSDDGILGGIAEKTGDSKVTLAVTDAAGASATKEYTFNVETAVPPRIPEQSIPAMSVGKFGEHRLISEAGNGIHSWRIKAGGVLPPGLNLAPDGRLWGSPGKQGEYTFTLEVLDGKTKNPGLAERSFTLRVGPPQGDVAFARRLTKAPTFDTTGKVNPPVNSADWNFRYPVRKLVAGETATVTGAFDVAWHEEHLYVAVKVDDATHNKGTWAQKLTADNVILCLDAFNNREATYNSDDRFSVWPRGSIYPQRSIIIGEEWGLICRQAELDGGYLAVFRVTWKNLGLPEKMSPHWTIGLDLMLVDDAKDGVPKSMVVWQGSQTNDKDPSQFGTVVLAE